MYHTFRHTIPDTRSAAPAFLQVVSADAEHMYNTANYFIRNTMTGLKKDTSERTDNEKQVISDVFRGIDIANERAEERFRKYIRMAASSEYHAHLAGREWILKAMKVAFFVYPTAEKWFLSYGTLDAIFKAIDNPVYRRMPSQVNQNAIRKAEQAWKSYFSAKKDYSRHPEKYKAMPRIPRYSHKGHATVWFTNQVCRPRFRNGKMAVAFTGCREELFLGKTPIAASWKFVKAELKVLHGNLTLLTTWSDSLAAPVTVEHPQRILGIDPGLNSLLAVANNFGAVPFIIDGAYLKSVNQWWNKRTSELKSVMMKGHDPEKYHCPTTKRMMQLSRDRDNSIRDYVYKACHYVCRFAQENHVDVIVIGHNKDQKQDSNMGTRNNQAFASIPFLDIVNCLVNTAAKYGIPVRVREESYTSKASLLDMDDIPTWKEDCSEDHTFSGSRIRRGLYRAKSGACINADINAAANILRKEYPYAFEGQTDLSWLQTTVISIRQHDLYPAAVSGRPVKAEKYQPVRKSTSALARHRQHVARKADLREAFEHPIKKTAEKSAA